MNPIIKSTAERATEAFDQRCTQNTRSSQSDLRLAMLRTQDQLDSSSGASEEDRREIERTLTETVRKPRLPRKAGARTTVESGDQKKRDVSTITLLAQVQALQARTYSNYWQTMWKQGSLTMQMSMQFAPTIAKATLNAYQQQSAATKADAGKELQSAWIAGISSGALVALGGYGAWKAAAAKNADIAVSKGAAGSTLEEATAKVDSAEAEHSALMREKIEAEQRGAAPEEIAEIDKKLVDAEKKFNDAVEDQKLAETHKDLWAKRDEAEAAPKEERAKVEAEVKEKEKEYTAQYNKLKADRGEMPSVLSNTMRSCKSTMKKIGLSLSEGCHHAMQSLNMVQMPMTVANAASGTQFDSEKAVHQALEGQCHALKSLGENFKANYDQNYQRSEDIRGMVQQYFDSTVIQTYKSAIETFSQTLIGMARA